MKTPALIGRPALLRRTNAQLLLQLLREIGPCSKADLVRACGLSAPTVTNVVAHLASVGLVEPIGEGDSTGGRPPDIIRFRAESGCVVGVEIGTGILQFLLTDLDGRDLGRSKVAVPRSSSAPSSICSVVRQEVHRLIQKHAPAATCLLGATVGVPAIVDVNEGTVLSLSALKNWRDVPLGQMLRKELKCAVMLENDTNLAALGEHYRGAAQGEDNFVFLTIGEGVGAGIFIGGKLYHGSQWSAGEIGYLRVPQISRQNPTINEYGRLEKVLGTPGILRSWRAAGRRTRVRVKIDDARGVLDLATEGNARAKGILKHRANIVADIVLNIAMILNPSVILLGGDVGSHPRLLQEMKSQLAGSEFGIPSVRAGALGTSAVLWGAVSKALELAILGVLNASNRRVDAWPKKIDPTS
jgi:predicted NBD/HSP70 family sugar kinase